MQPDAVRRRLASLPDLAVKGRPINGLYRLLASPVIWETAYENIAPNKGATTPGLTGQSLDGYSPQRVQSIIDRLMTGSYRFTPARRVRIPKRSGGSRPLGIPGGDDKLVQEAVRLILERIYEPVFSDHSHGFRRGRSPHTALESIRRTWTGVHWFVEADIKGCLVPSSHCLRVHGGCVKQGAFGLWDQYSQAFSTSAAYVDGFKLAALYTLQHGLAADAEDSHRVDDRHVAGGRVFDEQCAQLVVDADPPRGAGSVLLAAR